MCRATIRWLRAGSRYYFGTDDVGDHGEDLLICACIALGMGDGRLMSASDVEGYIGMPRATVHRRLKTMLASGVVGSRVEGRRRLYFLLGTTDPERSAGVERACWAALEDLTAASKLDD